MGVEAMSVKAREAPRLLTLNPIDQFHLYCLEENAK